MYWVRHGTDTLAERVSFARNHAFPLLFVSLCSFASFVFGQVGDTIELERSFQSGSQHFAAGRWPEAVKEFAKVSRSPGRRRNSAMFFLAESQLQADQPAQALDWYEKYLAQEPQGAHSRLTNFRLGEAAYLVAKYDKSRSHLQSFVERFGSDPLVASALTYLGEICLVEGKTDDAVQYFERCLQEFPSSKVRDDCRLGLARAYESLAKWDLAESALRQVMEGGNSNQLTVVDYRLALLYYRQDRYAEAAEQFQHFLDVHSASERRVEATYWLARSYAAQKDWASAIAMFREAASGAGQHRLGASIDFGLAEALRKSGQRTEAIDAYQTVIKKWPASDCEDDSRYMLLYLTSESDDLAATEELSLQFLDDYPNSDLRSQVIQTLARSYLANMRFDDARRVLMSEGESMESAIPDRTALWNRYYRAHADWGLGLHQEAAEAFERLDSQELEPMLRQAVTAMRFAFLYEQRDYRRAAQIMAANLELELGGDDRNMSQVRLALATAQLGEWERVDSCLQALDRELAKPIVAYLRQIVTVASQHRQSPIVERILELLDSLPEAISDVDYHRTRIRDDEGPADAARLAWQQFLMKHSGSPYAADATCRLAARMLESGAHRDVPGLVLPLLQPNVEPRIRGYALQLQMQALSAEGDWNSVARAARGYAEDESLEFASAAAYWLAESLYRLGEVEESMSEWRRLGDSGSIRDASRLGMIGLRQAQCLAQLRRWDELESALDRLEAAAPLASHKHDLDYLRGRCLIQRGRYDAARKRLEQVVRSADGGHSETAAMAQWLIGESWMLQKDYSKAIAAYELVQIYDYPLWKSAALMQEAKCLERSGQLTQSLLRYARIVQEFPDSKFARAASEKIDSLQADGRSATQLRK